MFTYSTILFDFDGTLTHSLPLWMRAYQFAFSQYGIELASKEVIERCFYQSWSEVVSSFNLPSIDEFGNHVQTGLEAAMPEAILFDDVEQLLSTCHGKSVKMGIVTSSTRRVVTKFLEEKNLDRYFGVVVTADDITNYKPHPEPVLKAMKELEAEPESTLFVGDSAVDMLAAHNAGLHRALFLPDEHAIFYNFEELKNHQPQFVFQRYAELLKRLEATSLDKEQVG